MFIFVPRKHKLPTEMRDNCKICGATIGENNMTGIGGGCMMNVVQPALKDTFFKFKYLEVYVEQVQIWRAVFLQQFESTKFRSEFKKSFYESIKSNDRISKKQLEIIKTQISYKDLYLYNETNQKSSDVFSSLLRLYRPANEEQQNFYLDKLEIYKKSYLSTRKKTDKDE